MMARPPAPSRRQSTKENHGERRIYISAGIGETERHAINPQKEDKSRRIDRSTTTPTKMQRLYLHSCNTSSIVKHPGLGQKFLNEWIKWASPTCRGEMQLGRGAFQTGSVKSSRTCREHAGSTCNLEEELSKRAPSSPERGPVNATGKKQGYETASNDGPRHCCCDEHCQACTSDAPFLL